MWSSGKFYAKLWPSYIRLGVIIGVHEGYWIPYGPLRLTQDEDFIISREELARSLPIMDVLHMYNELDFSL